VDGWENCLDAQHQLTRLKKRKSRSKLAAAYKTPYCELGQSEVAKLVTPTRTLIGRREEQSPRILLCSCYLAALAC
jgi:hypothetical protein